MGNTINIEKIRNYMEANGFSKAAFCKKCNLSVSVFNKIIAGQTNFRINALLKLARGMKVQLYELFE